MNKPLFHCVVVHIMAASALFAFEDTFAPPLFSDTRFELPAPYKKGEIIAKAHLIDVGDNRPNSKGTIVELLSLKVIIGSTVLNVSRPVLDLFPGANLASIRFFLGPPDDPDNPLYSSHPRPNDPAYFNVSFKHGGYSYESDLSFETGNTASICIKEGKIIALSSSWRGEENGASVYCTKKYDPETLKEIKHSNPQRPLTPQKQDAEPEPSCQSPPAGSVK